jgi:CTP:molybdopterin cytidylyltransferase MocA
VPYVKQEDLANNLATRLLTVVEDDARSGQSATIAQAGSWLPRQGACLIGLAQLASVTKRTTRDQIVATVLQATSDTRLSYSQTSGRVSPPKHAGADALTLLVPSLTREDLATATQAIPTRTPQQKPDDYTSMYTAVKAALAARREALPQEPK